MGTKAEARAAIEQALEAQGLGGLAGQLADDVATACLAWRVEDGESAIPRAILALAFGNRVGSSGEVTPGPINQALADMAVRYHEQEGGLPIFAQWEVGQCMGDRVPAASLTVLHPDRDDAGHAVYLSTRGVIEQVSRTLAPGSAVLLIAHADHLRRCARLAEACGLNVLARQADMPSDYDPGSGQPWTRTRYAYVLHDLASTLRDIEHRASE